MILKKIDFTFNSNIEYFIYSVDNKLQYQYKCINWIYDISNNKSLYLRLPQYTSAGIQ